jgi:hypothetical protein
VLATGDYDLTLISRPDASGFVDTGRALLDGEGDNTPGGDFVRQFNVNAPVSNQRVLSLPDFSRGPGQAIEDLLVSLDVGNNVSRAEFDLLYDATVLDITGVTLSDDLQALGWQLTQTDAPGRLSVILSGPVLATGSLDLGLINVDAIALSTAPYGGSQVLSLANLELNDGSVPAIADASVHQVAFPGDATGNGGALFQNPLTQVYSGSDAAQISRVSAGADSGFDAFPLTDPLIVGDVTGDRTLSGLDAAFVLRTAVGLPQPEIPPLPLL